jgi:hypothetical protein
MHINLKLFALVTIAALLPLSAFQCSIAEKEYECGCEGPTSEILTDVEGLILYKNKDDFLRISITTSNKKYMLIPCQLPDSLFKKIAFDSLHVRLTGDIKILCPDTRMAGQPIEIDQILIVEREND